MLIPSLTPEREQTDWELIESLAHFGAKVKLLNLQCELNHWRGSRSLNAPEQVKRRELELDQWYERLTVLGLGDVVAKAQAMEWGA